LHVAFRPSTATGFRLDWIGAKVGQRRIGPTDAVYRLYILARIAVNRSAGQVADLIRVAGILLTSYRYREAPTAVLVDTALGQVPAERAATWALLQAAAPAGVSVHLVESLTDGTTDLTFSTVAEGVDPSVQGFDSVAGLTLAGTWATVNGPIA
jgi:hypothetical protein